MARKTAKIFSTGGSQAVRLPAEFRFDDDEVYIHRDAVTGDVILSRKGARSSWAQFFKLRNDAPAPADFLNERPGNEPFLPRSL